MYNPKKPVNAYFRSLLKRPEGVVYLLLISGYLLAFVFFNDLVQFSEDAGVSIPKTYRLAFLFMPLALTAAFLRMDINAKGVGDRVLTVLVLIIVSAIPAIHFFRHRG